MRYSGKGLFVVCVLFGLAMAAAWILYGKLESVAEGTWVGFRLGGAVAVFVVTFLLLRATYERTLIRNIVKVQLTFAEDSVPAGGVNGASCSYSLYNRDTLERSQPHPVELIKEGAGLVFYVESKSAHDLICVVLETPQGERWESAHHPLHVAPIEMETNGTQG